MKDFLAHFGVPLELHREQGRNFDGELMKRLAELMGWAKTRTTPYHPSSNGLVERFNRTLLQMMRCFVSQNQDDWDEHIPLLAGAYRSTPHTSTGLTPNRLMLGREVHLPQEVMFGLNPVKEDEIPFIDKLRSSMKKCENIARENLKSASRGQKRLHDLRTHEKSYNPSDLVYIKDDAKKVGKSPKLQPLWKGPAVVARKLGQVLYEVITKKGSTILHHDRLKPCLLETVPRWISKARRQLQYCMEFDERREQVIQLKDLENHGEENTQSKNTEVKVIPKLPDVGEDMNLKDDSAEECRDTNLEDDCTTTNTTTRRGRKIKPPSRYAS